MRTFATLTTLLVALLAPPSTRALGLGQIGGHGALGSPLDAFVPLYLAPAERSALQSVEILPDVFARDDLTPLADLAAGFERVGDRDYVHITTNAALRVERLRFRLRVQTAHGAVVGRYALRVAPTPAAPLTPRTGAPAHRRIVARPIGAVPAAADAHHYGPVRPGESLWTIARRVAHDRDPRATIEALHAANPQAFIGGDRNRLRVGVILTVRVASTTGAEVRDIASSGDGDAHETPAPGDGDETHAAPPPVVDERATASAGLAAPPAPTDNAATATREPAVSAPTESGALSGQAAAPDEDLARRLRELDAKFTALRAKYEPRTAAADEAAPPAVAAPRRAADTRARHSAPIGATPSARDTGDWRRSGLLSALLLAGMIVVFPRLKHHVARLRTRGLAADAEAADADRRAEVARKAESRVRLESEVRSLIRRQRALAPTAAAPGPAAAALNAEYGSARTAAARAEEPTRRELSTAIDVEIVHGRYTEAETLLRETIAAHPEDVQAKLRLAEVYYITEQLDGFTAVATELMRDHRAQLSDEDRQRVVRMGKIVTPDLPLFSGTVARKRA